jgi:hypothetical protein
MNNIVGVLIACCFLLVPLMVNVDASFIRKNLSSKYLNDSRVPYYKKSAFAKDTMNANMIGTTEEHPFVIDDQPSQAWTDANVSTMPDYYTSEFKNNIMDLSLFFDKNNRFSTPGTENIYVDLSKYQYPSRYCQLDQTLTNSCNFNGKLKMAPISRNNVGLHGKSVTKHVIGEEVQDINNNQYLVLDYENDSVNNGGAFGTIKGYETLSDSNSPILKPNAYTCS